MDIECKATARLATRSRGMLFVVNGHACDLVATFYDQMFIMAPRREDVLLAIASHQEAVDVLTNLSGNVNFELQYIATGESDDDSLAEDIHGFKYRFFDDEVLNNSDEINIQPVYYGLQSNSDKSCALLSTPTAPRTPESMVGLVSRQEGRFGVVDRAGQEVRRVTTVDRAGREVRRVTAVDRAGREVRRVTAVDRAGREVRRVTVVDRAGRGLGSSGGLGSLPSGHEEREGDAWLATLAPEGLNRGWVERAGIRSFANDDPLAGIRSFANDDPLAGIRSFANDDPPAGIRSFANDELQNKYSFAND
uniref:Uncharacterized protein n=1 Tax=Timema bartmani TaxID=61472 RepID=A0A7R9F2Z7_9NEOP|nr:unnamed protein product [Timema bartmani]